MEPGYLDGGATRPPKLPATFTKVMNAIIWDR